MPQIATFLQKCGFGEMSNFLDFGRENSDLGLLFTVFRANGGIEDFMMKFLEIMERFYENHLLFPGNAMLFIFTSSFIFHPSRIALS